MEETDLNNLLINAEQLALNPEENIGELPKIERTLKQVYDATNELWSRLTSEGLKDNEANLLLSSRGVDLPHLSQRLERITARRSLQPLDPTPVTDIDAFLKNELENSILSIVEYTSHSLEEDFQKKMDEEVRKSARNRRLKFLNCLYGLSELDPDIPVTRKVYPLKEIYFNSASHLDQYQIAYAEKLMEFNKDVLNGKTRADLLSKFVSVISPQDQKISELWKITSIMSQLPPVGKTSVLEARTSPMIVDKLIRQARIYLENRYKVFMESVVASNMLKACRGGEPGIYSLVRSFIKASNLSEYLGMEQLYVDDLPFWPVFYYCLRCGDLDAALHCIRQLSSDFGDLMKIVGEMKNTPSRRLTPQTEKNFLLDYKRMVRNTPDPYKRIVYCAIGGCDVTDKHPEVVKTADDYLWLRLCQIRDDGDESSSDNVVHNTDRLTYSLLQSLISEEYGETYFNASEQPHVYFQMLFLTGQFEAGIEILYRSAKFATHSVHIAIAMNEFGLLALSDNISRPVVSSIYEKDPKPLKRLNFCAMVKTYAGTLPEADSEVALNYLFCLRNVSYTTTGKDLHMFPQLVYELVLNTERYDQILGYLEPDGCRVKGLYDEFADSKFRSEDLIYQVASHLESKGDYFNAIKLYELCGNYEKVLMVWSSQMSRHLTNMSSQSEEIRNKLYSYSESFLQRTDPSRITMHADTKCLFDSFYLLFTFFQYYNNKEYQPALSIIQQSKFLPFMNDEVELKVNEFKSADMLVIQVLPDVLIAVMNILHFQYNSLKQGYSTRQTNDSVDKIIASVRQKAQAITSFVGRVPFQFTSDIYSRLVQMEVSMQ
ncbi:hypothetical protein V9T40_012604 [Parthenolecanium corni]|uniref:Nuclear pore protein n=1 Tax=Parthenolecanium corni TaxID=536013 RepID=A0AAN9Y0Q2_9HEMI